MQTLVEEYKKSIALINERIRELEKIKFKLVSASNDPEKDPDVIELQERLKPLRNMQTDLTDVKREVYHYYDSWWYRSPDYTFNQRKGKKYMY